MRVADWDLKYAITPEKYIALENRPRKLFSRIHTSLCTRRQGAFLSFLDVQFR